MSLSPSHVPGLPISITTGRKGLRSISPVPSIRSVVSISSNHHSDKDAKSLRSINAVVPLKSAVEPGLKANDGFGDEKVKPGRKARTGSERQVKELVDKEKERKLKPDEAVAAQLLTKRDEDVVKASKPTNVESTVLQSPKPQKLIRFSFIQSQANQTEVVQSKPATPIRIPSVSVTSISGKSVDLVCGSIDAHDGSGGLEVMRSESCPPIGSALMTRSSSSSSSSSSSLLNVKAAHGRPLTAIRRSSADSALSTRLVSAAVPSPSPQVATVATSHAPYSSIHTKRLTKTSRIFRPFHTYNRHASNGSRPAVLVRNTGREKFSAGADEVYKNASVIDSTISLPGKLEIPDSLNKLPIVTSTPMAVKTAQPMRSTPLRTTMRKPEKRKHVFNSEKPWKHLIVTGTIAEGDRKRYDALWAANKGTLLPADLSSYVHGLIVKQIWQRSRLGDEKLEKIWNLVNRCDDQQPCLSRDEFLVGTWIVDQCLYGRKLPLQLSSEVWSGVSRLGVNIPDKIKTKRKIHDQRSNHHNHQ
ncbi:hypothetical protein V1514DRAFT_334397 [Lipomyces japonicus]|uniref:uncharacterized protein n=1 Tax=Lipomyces japonicus TaxID=56871 RepID=UPI0034CFC75A